MYRISCYLCVLDVQVMLMTDILVFLQEKDQRFIFACLVSYFSIKYIISPCSCDTVKQIVVKICTISLFFTFSL